MHKIYTIIVIIHWTLRVGGSVCVCVRACVRDKVVGCISRRSGTDDGISNTNLNLYKLNLTQKIIIRLLCCKSPGTFDIVLDCNKNSNILLDCQVIVSEKEFFDIQRVVDLGCIKQCNTRIWVIGTVKEKMIGIFHYKINIKKIAFGNREHTTYTRKWESRFYWDSS